MSGARRGSDSGARAAHPGISPAAGHPAPPVPAAAALWAQIGELGESLVHALVAAGSTAATAESLTGGLVSGALTAVAGSSAAVRGGVVAYATPLKASVLRVDADLLRLRGAVDPDVAAQMATGVRELLGATYGLATTGVAGPSEQDGRPVGTVFVAVAGPDRVTVRELALSGDREQVRLQSVREVMSVLVEMMPAHAADPPTDRSTTTTT